MTKQINFGSYPKTLHENTSVMYAVEIQLQNSFDRLTKTGIAQINAVSDLLQALAFFEGSDETVLKAFILWGIEMNYLPSFLTMVDSKNALKKLQLFLCNKDRVAAFVLSSAYSILHKSFFFRNLTNTNFGNGIASYCLSDEILAAKYQIGLDVLIAYLKDLFQYSDLGRASYFRQCDFFSWALDEIDPPLLVRAVQIVNDSNFQKTNRDILGDIYEQHLGQERPNGDKTYRQILGQYYTPKPIVRLMWHLVRDVLKTTRQRDLYDLHGEFLRVLDPCCGSGTFLCEGLLQLKASSLGKPITKDGYVVEYHKERSDKRRAEDYYTGFEINPLSKNIADINMFFSTVDLYSQPAIEQIPIQKNCIFRTDSIEVGERACQMLQSLFTEDTQPLSTALDQAKTLKYDIVITNPPYASVENADKIVEAFIPFAIPRYNFDEEGRCIPFQRETLQKSGKVPNHEKNRGKLKDLYSLFFGVADQMCNEGGIVAYITPNTWLAIPTYKFLRKYFLENYTIHYIINFNNISDRSSMFEPEAGIATAIVVMSNTKPPLNHHIRYCDFSTMQNTKERFEALANIQWEGRSANHHDIISFDLHPIENLPWVEVNQIYFLTKPDYMVRVSENDHIIAKMEVGTTRLSMQMADNQGVDAGDLSLLVAETRTALREKIEQRVFTGKLDTVSKTAAVFIQEGLKTGKIETTYSLEKEHPFAYQKEFERYHLPKTAWIYLDHGMVWRSRLKRGGGPILASHKLFVLERREQNRLIALVTDKLVIPQHGGRFFYFVESKDRNLDDLHTFCAMINSAPINFYYQRASQGNKDIHIRLIDEIDIATRQNLASSSKRLHSLMHERVNENLNHPEFLGDLNKIDLAISEENAVIDKMVGDVYNLTPVEIAHVQMATR